MKLIEVKILVDTEKLINDFPGGTTLEYIENPGEYIAMSITGGSKFIEGDIDDSGGPELGFTAFRNTALRFYGVPKDPQGNVRLVDSGDNVPRGCLVDGIFHFKEGVVTGTTVNTTQSRVAYNFVIQVDDFDFKFVWDPFLGVGNQ